MTDPLTASVLVTLAIQEFIKSGTGDLAKRFTAEAVAKIPVLWRKENQSRSMKHWLNWKVETVRTLKLLPKSWI